MNKFQTIRAYRAPVAAAGLAVLAGASNAAIDVAGATGGIAEAGVAVLAVLAAMITMGVAVWGVKKVLKFFRG